MRTKPPLSKKMVLEESIKLKHSINQSITYGGLNSREVQEMADNLTPQQYAELSRQLSQVKKTWYFIPSFVWWVGLLTSCCCSIFFYGRPIASAIAILIGAYCTWEIAYRGGVQYGYERGYESGHTAGVYKVLGIKSEDAADISSRSTEMELDEMWIKAINRSKQEPDEDGDLRDRILCSDGNCIGVIGQDGYCRECGKPYSRR